MSWKKSILMCKYWIHRFDVALGKGTRSHAYMHNHIYPYVACTCMYTFYIGICAHAVVLNIEEYQTEYCKRQDNVKECIEGCSKAGGLFFESARASTLNKSYCSRNYHLRFLIKLNGCGMFWKSKKKKTERKGRIYVLIFIGRSL